MSIKIIIIALVAILSGIFFWQTTNRFLYPSKAALTTTPTPWPYLVPSSNAPTASSGSVATPTLPTNASDSRITPTGSITTGGTTTPPGVCNKSKGDFNCDGKIDFLDFDIFRREFVGGLTSKNSDANADSKVDFLDFDILRKGMFP